MDTNKATPDLKPSAQPPSPEDLMEARRVDEEGSKVPARESIYTVCSTVSLSVSPRFSQNLHCPIWNFCQSVTIEHISSWKLEFVSVTIEHVSIWKLEV